MFTRRVISRVSEQITPVWFRSRERPLCGKQRDCVSVREKTTECMIMRFRRTKHLRRKQGGEGGGSEKPLNRILMLFVASWKWILENYHLFRNYTFFDWMKNAFRLFSMQTARQMSLMSISNWLELNHKLYMYRSMEKDFRSAHFPGWKSRKPCENNMNMKFGTCFIGFGSPIMLLCTLPAYDLHDCKFVP